MHIVAQEGGEGGAGALVGRLERPGRHSAARGGAMGRGPPGAAGRWGGGERLEPPAAHAAAPGGAGRRYEVATTS